MRVPAMAKIIKRIPCDCAVIIGSISVKRVVDHVRMAHFSTAAFAALSYDHDQAPSVERKL